MIPFDDVKGIKKLFILMLIGTIISFALIYSYNHYDKAKYPMLDTEDSLKGNVLSLSTYQSVVMVSLSNDKRYMIVHSGNYAYRPYLLQKFLREGDYLEKKAGSDTIHVIRDEKIYTFVLGQELNQELVNYEE